jgi:outer membrane lipoprotein-sorting protein
MSHRIITTLMFVGFACSCAQAQVRPSAPTPAKDGGPVTREANNNVPDAISANASIDQILDALHDVGQGLKDFSADVTMKEADEGTQLSSTRTGKVWYQLKGDGDPRMRVTFDKVVEGDLARDEKIEYKLDGGWLVDRNYRKKLEVNRQVLRPGEKINLLKLGEGPFPLPIGQDKQDVHKLFDITQPDEKSGGADAAPPPPNSVHLQLKPKSGSQFAKKFTTIDVWVDRASRMPVRIDTREAADEQKSKSTELSDVHVNAGLTDDAFTLPKIDDQEWTRHDEPFVE